MPQPRIWCVSRWLQSNCRHVSFRYEGAQQDTLSALHLSVADGEAHALLGASGAGKTTLLNLLSGLLTPTGGRILFDGEDVSKLPGRARSVAQVFQFPVLYESLSVEDNLAFPLRVKKAPRQQIAQRLQVVCEELELNHLRKAQAAGAVTVRKAAGGGG